MDEPAYKEDSFICVKCGKRYKFTLTSKSEIVLIEELGKEYGLILKMVIFSSYVSMIGLIVYGFQTIKPTDPFFIPFVIGSVFMTFMMLIPKWNTVKEWILTKKEEK